MAVWKRVSGWTDTLRKKLAEALSDEEPQQIIVEQRVTSDGECPVTDDATSSSETVMNDDGAPPASAARPPATSPVLDTNIAVPLTRDPAPAPTPPETSYGGVAAGLTKYGLSAWYLIGIGLVVGFVIFATAKVQMVFIAVFVAFVLTSLLNPPVRLLSRWMPRAAATAISLLTTFVFFGGLLFYVGYSVSGEWNDLSDKFSIGVSQIFQFLEKSPIPLGITHKEINANLQDIIATSVQWVQDNAGSIATQAVNSAGTVALVFTMLALAIFTAIFFLLSGSKMWLWFINLVPAKNRVNVHRSAAAGWKTFSGYARGTIIIAVTDGLLALVLLLIVKIPLAAPLAVLVMIGAVIPLVGAPAAMVIAMIVALAAEGIWKAAIVGIGIALIGQFEGHILQPLVMGKQVSIHPVAVAVGVAAGTFLAGLIGAIIAIPIIAVMWEVYKTLRQPDAPVTSLSELDGRTLTGR